MRPAFDPALYLVTDTALAGARGVPDVVRAAVAGGVTAVQVRDKTASRRELYQLTLAVREVLVPGVALVVNDAVDVALLAGADGVHVGQSDLPAAEVRALIGPDRLLGLSVGTDDELAAALALPPGTLDVVGLGPVWAPPRTARTELLSTTTRSRFSRPRSPRAVTRAVCAASQTPAAVHAWNRAQQVEPDPHPRSAGRDCHRSPTRRT